jgi:hypothetical protein
MSGKKIDITLTFQSPYGRGSGVVSWTTTADAWNA